MGQGFENIFSNLMFVFSILYTYIVNEEVCAMKLRFLTTRQYWKLYERARRMLDWELRKPSSRWDRDLIYELEETMLFISEQIRNQTSCKKQ